MKRLLVCTVPFLFLSAAPSLNYDNDNAIRFANQTQDDDGNAYLVSCRRDRIKFRGKLYGASAGRMLRLDSSERESMAFERGLGVCGLGEYSVGGYDTRSVCPSDIWTQGLSEYSVRSAPEYGTRTFSSPSYSIQSILPQQFSSMGVQSVCPPSYGIQSYLQPTMSYSEPMTRLEALVTQLVELTKQHNKLLGILVRD